MGNYRVIIKPSVRKDFRGLPKNIAAKVFSIIENLAANPFSDKAIKLEGSERTYRIRIGDYRIVYEIEKAENLVTVLYVRHRREIYRNF